MLPTAFPFLRSSATKHETICYHTAVNGLCSYPVILRLEMLFMTGFSDEENGLLVDVCWTHSRALTGGILKKLFKSDCLRGGNDAMI